MRYSISSLAILGVLAAKAFADHPHVVLPRVATDRPLVSSGGRGVAAAKRAAAKRRNQIKAKRHG